MPSHTKDNPFGYIPRMAHTIFPLYGAESISFIIEFKQKKPDLMGPAREIIGHFSVLPYDLQKGSIIFQTACMAGIH